METIRGFIEHIIYRNTDNGYTVLNLISGGEEITCVGFFKTMDQGETIEARGSYTSHPVYGEQFKIEQYEIVPPADVESIERYLGSGAVKGVGAVLASRIVRRFGEDTYRIIEDEPERLAEISGISERKAREIAAQVYEKRDAREAMAFLQQYGISNTMAIRIYETYGLKLYGILKENPYRLAEDIQGIGFRIADEIASQIGIRADSDYRIQSGILYTLTLAGAEGHCYVPQSILLRRTSQLLGIEAGAIEAQLSGLAMDQKLIIRRGPEETENKIYAPVYFYAELSCAKMLHDLRAAVNRDGSGDMQTGDTGEEGAAAQDTAEAEINARISRIEDELGIRLDGLQKRAVLESVRNGIFILTGGPGTGKTTTINVMIRYFLSEGMDIHLAAPTGRAAKRMAETTGYEAKTIHRLLELSGTVPEETKTARFERNEDNPLEADVIIVDEMSMVDIFLFQALLRAISVGTRLIMVGDRDQLPSVGAGQVLRDLMESARFPAVVLEKIFRQAGESDIVWNAHRIQAGESLALDNRSRDFFFLERNDVNVIYKHMIQLITEKLPPYVGAKPYEIQVLTPMRKGSLGVETLNGILQKYLNPPSASKKECTVGDLLLRENDKVMQIKNNYQLEWEITGRYGIPVDRGTGVFNGDIGTVIQINDYAAEVTVEYDEHRRVTYSYSQLNEIELAYAVTVHKSQGSEYPAVIMPLLSGPGMLLNRSLLYTGVTRAKSCVTILGSRRTVQEMIDNNNQNVRYTSLSERIREMIPSE